MSEAKMVLYLENLPDLPGMEDEKSREDLLWLLGAPENDERAEAIMERLPRLQEWVRGCYHRPPFEERRRAAVNEMLEGHGLEVMREDFASEPLAEYVNMGDPYILTVVWPMEGEFEGVPHILSWGDYLELREQRMLEAQEGLAP